MTVRVVDSYRGVRGARLYDTCAEERPEGPTVAIVAVTHGNETVGVGVLERIEALVGEKLIAGRVLAVYANLRAYEEGTRFTEDGMDLNRLYDRATLDALRRMPAESLCYEESRALELAPLLIDCDALLDLHSTSRPSEAFLLFRDDQRHASMATSLGVEKLVTGMHETAIVEGGLCSNVGLDPGEHSDRLGFTFEAGQHGDAGNVERAWQVVERFLFRLGVWGTEPPAVDVVPKVYEIISRMQQAPPGTKPWVFADPEPRGGTTRKLESFEAVHTDEVLVRRGSAAVRAESPFTMLMPAPDARPLSDLFFTAQRRHGGLAWGQFRTTAEARREAHAIERMLDLLGDDQMQDGVSWVTFDSRRCLDLCADLISRTIRLPAHHPHRKITIVGRGDWGGGDAERLNGLRYRVALRSAIAAGVPIERLQMMRGATLGWLDALTGSAMRQGMGGMQLRFSVHQPHTVSLLVIGDPVVALRDGMFRSCRVAIVIEAATVEPVEDSAVVHVVRTGTVSARPEVLRAALRVVEPLRAEHTHLARATSLFRDPRLQAMIEPDGSFGSVQDPGAAAALRERVLGLQLKLWVKALRPELAEPLSLPTNRAMGRWLASVMTRTGILDVDSLRKLLVRPQGTGWVADLRHLERLAENPTAEALDDILEGIPDGPMPTQPVCADDVDGDNLERWIGWKRYVRQVNPIAGGRGKDLDLVFSERNIRRRLTRWLQEAGADAVATPGKVLVVMAGDGLNPQGTDPAGAETLRDAHRALLLNGAARYLRIQHAQGTHLGWMKDVVDTLQRRPAGSQPVSVLFEGEHGATVNMILVCSLTGEPTDWSLEGWSVDRCAVIVSDLGADAADHKLALFTERLDDGTVNTELLHFGRSHCEGLLKQVGWRGRFDPATPPAEILSTLFCRHLERWVEQVRGLEIDGLEDVPANGERAAWVARQLGLADPRLAAALAGSLGNHMPPAEIAAGVWRDVQSWRERIPDQTG